MTAAYTTREYLLEDWPRTLFPMETTRYLAEQGSDLLYDYLYSQVFAAPRGQHFAGQALCYAAKAGFHLRRTLKLDPTAELFLYDLVYRKRTSFKKDHLEHRRSYGYRFSQGKPISPMMSYRHFRRAVTAATHKYRYSLKLDVALYFNSIYHHDLVGYFAELGWDAAECQQLGTFLREINSGRSIDCLPQGLNPSKTLGAEFLKFIDHSSQIRSPLLLRFLDDIYLFAESEQELTDDLLTIQQLLGEKGLSLNDAKTALGEGPAGTIEQEVDAIKQALLQLRQDTIEVSGEPVVIEQEEYDKLDETQTDYLMSLLRHPEIDEADAELVLNLLTEHGEAVLEHLGDFLPRFPVLAKTIYTFLGKTDAREGLAQIFLDFLNAWSATEYQLFWIARCAETYLPKDPAFGDLLMKLFEHKDATAVTQARILEIPEHRFGMPELRATHLRSGESTWRSWAAAVGCRRQTPHSRNHLLSYFANGSPINRVISSVLTR